MNEQIQEDTTRPGYATRGPEFDKLVFMAESFDPVETISQAEIVKAIVFGLYDLTDKEKHFLLIVTSMLSHREIQKGNAFCYLGGYSLRRALGGKRGPIDKRSLSRIKSSLEAQGLIIRHYDNRHRPQEGLAIDLRPLLARLSEIHERTDDFFQQTRDYFGDQQALDREGYQNKEDIRVMEGCLQSQPNRLNPTNVNNTVQTNKELSLNEPITNNLSYQQKADNQIQIQNNISDSQENPSTSICSPKGASVFWKGYEKSSKQRHLKARAELKEALGLSEQLSSYIPLSAIETSDETVILDGCYKFILENFVAKRNTDKTFHWALKKFGWKAVLLLICAVEDETIISREGWIGHMTTKSKRTLDLQTNFTRIKRRFDSIEIEETPKKGTDLVSERIDTEDVQKEKSEINLKEFPVEPDPNQEFWTKIKNQVLAEELMAEAEVKSWLDKAQIINLGQSRMILGVKTAFHRDCLERNFIPILEKQVSKNLNRDVEIIIEIIQDRKNH